MTYAELLARLFAARRFGVKLGLAPMQAALAAMGRPDRRMGAVVHVAGTNGKGSTCAFVEQALRAAGYRVGLYTSPHLCRFTERIRVGGAEADGARLAERGDALRELLEPLTFFEQATLLAIDCFAAAGTEVAVLEVGLGGRLDATNAVVAEVGVVTGVALDHTDVLGATLEAIAVEKAGIFKPGQEAVLGACGEPSVRPYLHELARAAGVADVTLAASTTPPSWLIGLRGPHQVQNAACALAALDALERATGGRIRVPVPTRRTAFAATRWPGRLEEIASDPRIWIDGAHNPQGAEILAGAVRAERPTRLCAVVGVSSDKDLFGVLRPIVSLAECVVTVKGPSERALPALEVARAAARLPGPPGRQIHVAEDVREAMAIAGRETKRQSDLCVVYGSLFVVGAVRPLFTGEDVDPLTVQDPPASASEPGPGPGPGAGPAAPTPGP